jgi:hydroxyacylglutathione hydrolase
VAAQLFRHGFQGTVTIVEPRAALGRGLAYSTSFDEHLLNVPAGKMSALPAEPSHF